jgi:glyoxylase-like metal-dependent hydrolase (beta-lactamase superfamily II)
VPVRDGQALAAGGLRVTVTATPGHTPGSVCYVIDGRLLFTGDTVRLRQGVALPRRSWTGRGRAAAVGSLRRLARLEGLELLLTAHTGTSDDPAGALRRWRAPLAGGTVGGDGVR